MKTVSNARFGKALMAGAAISLISLSAYAFGSGLNSTINERGDLMQFRNLIARTHVVENLPTGSYTVFAPVDSAFVEVTSNKFPCFYTVDQCTNEQADILRNHIVQGEVNLHDAASGKGGVFSIDKRHVAVSEPTKGEFYVDGHKVLSSNLTSSGMLYVIDGVIATPQELADFKVLRTPVVVETKTEKTTIQTKLPDPDSSSMTTTTTTTTVKDVQ